LSRDTAMLAQMKVTNGKLKKLARVISAPLPTEAVQAPTDGGQVMASTKVVDGKTVVLAVNVLGEKARAKIAVAGLMKGTPVEVLEEGRMLTSGDGVIEDAFEPYQEHIYRVMR
jgi:hypothetical protein